MADTIFLDIQPGTWTDLTALVGFNALIGNAGNSIIVHRRGVTQPDDDDTAGYRVFQDGKFDFYIPINDQDEKIWITSLKETGTIAVTTGVAVGAFHGAVNIHDADVHHLVINEYVSRPTGVATTLAADVAAQSRVINVVSAVGFTVGSLITVKNGFEEATFPRIIGIAGTALTLNQPLDNSYLAGDSVIQIATNMAVDGSVTPVSFKLQPERGETWHVVRFLPEMVLTSAADDSLFGNLTALLRGVVIRGYNAQTNSYRTFTNWSSNSDIKSDMYDVTYTDKAGPGLFGLSGRGSIKIGTGAVPELAPDDYIEILIQDNLTTLNSFRIKIQGHVVGN